MKGQVNDIIAMVVLTLGVMLLLTYFTTILLSQNAYEVCVIANLTIFNQSNTYYITSSKPAIIHAYFLYPNGTIITQTFMTQGIFYYPGASLVVAVTPFNVAWIGKYPFQWTLFFTPCGVTNYLGPCYPFLAEPGNITSFPQNLPACTCNYKPIVAGGILGVCRVS